MNFFQLINAVLTQLDLPLLDKFDNAKLPVHVKIKANLNRANQEIISFNDWWFKKCRTDFDSLKPHSNKHFSGNELVEIRQKNQKISVLYDLKNFVVDEFGNTKKYLDNENDKSIIPEPYGSEMLVYWVCMEINQEPNNPKYVHWKQRYNNAFSHLYSAGKPYEGTPVFKIKRG